MAKGKKSGGRRPGSLNKATVEAKEACTELVDDPDYRRSLGERLRAGTFLPPSSACVDYRKGKPREEVRSDITVSWQNVSPPD